ncbi:NAD-dependent epimerase/dehydratase family protein [Streptomyces alkaliterrae]|uniref:Reductase n=1 Tax=Streptomyces alkaliterrae TaxID=2213162 RepID=A0A5P0YSD4_9ACTN|nr:NAD-dependent epimerase/dehydratase family protein [Streptomyces alkaliterrae]MBB1254845.1 reductase [Streptomyces alkaliterrae]MBB1258727.1 reductase [Streptomyces alkaliterrae]MQS03226.1 reductase [Streptomyces alkaliterrae]
MRLLLLGGTDFVGRVIAEEAVARGWRVTVFSRGNRSCPEGASALFGDRTRPDGLAALAVGEWDAVVDTWIGAPRVVRESARLLAGRVRHFGYVSSRSVHPLPQPPGADESAPVVDAAPEGEEGDYAHNKRGGELAAVEVFGDGALLVRAGLVLGRYENAGRLPWWLRRVARGGRILAPGPPDLPLQYVDVRDLAAWTLDRLAAAAGGPYNVVSPSGHTTMGGLLAACREVTGADARLEWLTPEEVGVSGLEPWRELPIYLPPGETHDSLHRADVSKAVAAGLRCRPVEETVADTWEWLRRERPTTAATRPPVGMSAEAEQAALRRFRP